MDEKKKNCLQASDYEHPAEKSAFYALKRIPVLDKVVAAYLKFVSQWELMPEVQGDFYRVTRETAPELYELYLTALKRLDMEEEYPLYVKAEFDYNAHTSGGSAPFVVIHSSVLSDMADDEILFILGHELGHVKSGHVIYKVMAENINMLIAQIPMFGTMIFSAGLHLALMDWFRIHEYSADRAGAIAAGSVESGIRGLGKLLGISDSISGVKFEIEDLLRQNDQFEESNKDILSRIFCTMQIMNSSHPWTVTRIQELNGWKESGEYKRLTEQYGRQENIIK